MPKFTESDNGHIWCTACRGSFDSDAAEIRAMVIDKDAIAAIDNREDYRRLFVETWEIGDASGDVYTDFDWDDNQALQRGVAQHIIDALTRAGVPADAKLLDVGCGNGFTTAILAEKYGKDNIIGIDPSPLIEQLQGRTGVRGVRGTLDAVKFEDGQFDAVVIVGNLMLHPDMAATLAEAHRILKPGGVVVFDFKNIDSASRVVARWLGRVKPSLTRKNMVERNFVNMRFGLAKRHIPMIAPPSKFTILESYDKPPRLLEFSNRSHYQAGVAGLAWRFLNFIDRVTGQQAWLQVTARKREG